MTSYFGLTPLQSFWKKQNLTDESQFLTSLTLSARIFCLHFSYFLLISVSHLRLLFLSIWGTVGSFNSHYCFTMIELDVIVVNDCEMYATLLGKFWSRFWFFRRYPTCLGNFKQLYLKAIFLKCCCWLKYFNKALTIIDLLLVENFVSNSDNIVAIVQNIIEIIHG